jgi:hypothetical protein
MHILKITKYLNNAFFLSDMGRREELDQDLVDYLSGKKRKKLDVIEMIKGIMPKSSPPPVELPPEIQTYDAKEEKKVEEKPKVEILDEEEKPKTDLEEYGEESPSLWEGILRKFGMKPSSQVEKEEAELKEHAEEEKIKEMVGKELVMKDMRDLAKMTLFVIKQLPPERLKEFKQSTDFTDLKEILKKYKFIK